MKEKEEYIKYCVDLMQKEDYFEECGRSTHFKFETLAEALEFVGNALYNSDDFEGALAVIYEE